MKSIILYSQTLVQIRIRLYEYIEKVYTISLQNIQLSSLNSQLFRYLGTQSVEANIIVFEELRQNEGESCEDYMARCQQKVNIRSIWAVL